MTEPTAAQRRGWMTQWRLAGPALERVRLQELSVANLGRIAADLNDACIVAASTRALSTTSGLVAQQYFFHRTRPK